MTELLHLTERPRWEAALASGRYEGSTRGVSLAEQGFIHCSLAHQLPAVAEFVYGDHPRPEELVVLVIDDGRVDVPIRYEAMEEGGEEYPHIYGPLKVEAVSEVRPWSSDRRS
ncbi:DUF952 domain-containing protein [Glycomyces salinus]|uniref:DUF952 domain-containing protein n=1 Tax=Glycomyces salinus TaxID=980294 RepID=UPI0018EBBB6D|nr:DUF952 domain-containing protein [Glycomyces salinus]